MTLQLKIKKLRQFIKSDDTYQLNHLRLVSEEYLNDRARWYESSGEPANAEAYELLRRWGEL